jgi:hypothetical protein
MLSLIAHRYYSRVTVNREMRFSLNSALILVRVLSLIEHVTDPGGLHLIMSTLYTDIDGVLRELVTI